MTPTFTDARDELWRRYLDSSAAELQAKTQLDRLIATAQTCALHRAYCALVGMQARGKVR